MICYLLSKLDSLARAQCTIQSSSVVSVYSSVHIPLFLSKQFVWSWTEWFLHCQSSQWQWVLWPPSSPCSSCNLLILKATKNNWPIILYTIIIFYSNLSLAWQCNVLFYGWIRQIKACFFNKSWYVMSIATCLNANYVIQTQGIGALALLEHLTNNKVLWVVYVV